MKKECNSLFPTWTRTHQDAFDEIKRLVLSHECLTTIDHTNPGDNKIFVTCDASKHRIGSVLSFGPSWETARPVAFESRAMQGAELRYPMHEQELLLIIHSLRKWRSDLLGSKIEVFTDYRTLENFGTQRELSARQARWMEFLSQYDMTIMYISGDINTAANALSHFPERGDINAATPTMIAPVLMVSSDLSLISDIREGYEIDPWCRRLLDDLKGDNLGNNLGISRRDRLLFTVIASLFLNIMVCGSRSSDLLTMPSDTLVARSLMNPSDTSFTGQICDETCSPVISLLAPNVKRTSPEHPNHLDLFTLLLYPMAASNWLLWTLLGLCLWMTVSTAS